MGGKKAVGVKKIDTGLGSSRNSTASTSNLQKSIKTPVTAGTASTTKLGQSINKAAPKERQSISGLSTSTLNQSLGGKKAPVGGLGSSRTSAASTSNLQKSIKKPTGGPR